MKTNSLLSEQLVTILNGGQAHMTFEDAVKNFPLERINDIFPNGTYSAWDLLEHIRITQEDILDFITNAKYKEKEWPKEYWPEKDKKATKKDWDESIKHYHADLENLKKIVKNSQTDIYKNIAHGDGQTILREILLVADHSSYHIGEFAIMRQVMQTWTK